MKNDINLTERYVSYTKSFDIGNLRDIKHNSISETESKILSTFIEKGSNWFTIIRCEGADKGGKWVILNQK